MNWDWDKLQEKRQRQNWRQEPGNGNRNENDDREPDSKPSGSGGFNNPFKTIKWPPVRSGGGVKYVLLALVGMWLLSGIYIVDPDEEGVVLRFGRYLETVAPGPHYHLPYPIEEVYRPKVTQVQRIEVGFRSVGNTLALPQGQARVLPEEASMLTGDENIVNIQFSVQYQIKNPVEYLFNVTNQAAVVKNAAEAVMREVIGNSLIDSALADGKIKIQTEVATLLQDVLDRYKVGVRVLAVQMQDVHPPKEVSEAFKDVASAREDKSRIINEAEAYRNELLPKARGLAAEVINQAAAYKETRTLNAQGETKRFLALVDAYNAAKDATKQRMYLETIEEILSKPGMEKLILSNELAKGALPLLPLDRMMDKSGAARANGGANANSGGQDSQKSEQMRDNADTLSRGEK